MKVKNGGGLFAPIRRNPRKIRESLGLNQQEFWAKVGITQSGGSRYESGNRPMPKPVRELFRLVYIEGIDLKRVNAQDLRVGRRLYYRNQNLYYELSPK